MKLKKLFSVVTAFCICLSLFIFNFEGFATASTFSLPFEVYSEGAYLVNLDTGDVLYSKNADTKLVPASLTKLMTFLIILEDYTPDELRTKYATATSQSFDELYLTGCSNADIRIGEAVSYIDLLYALILRSACEAANILAIDSYGSLQAFINRMNEKAQELGMENTHFSNTHGLFPEDNYTTPADLAKLIIYGIENYSLFTEISYTDTYEMEETSYHSPRLISHTNYMMSPGNGGEYYYPYIKGIKTGTTDEAGRCLASTASKDGYTYLLITMNAPQKDNSGNNVYYNFVDHKNIYEWAFTNLEYTEIINKNEEIASIPVAYGDGVESVNLKTADGYSQIWNKTIEKTSAIQRIITKNEDVIAPVKAGDVLGSLELRYSGNTLAVIDLVAVKDVERDTLVEQITIAKSFIGSKYFKTAIISSIAFFVVYTALFIVYVNLRNRKLRQRYRASTRNVSRRR